jgi:membrane-bound ClpP family serine protease
VQRGTVPQSADPEYILFPSSVLSAAIKELSLIILGVILLIIGFVAKIAIIWTIGIIVVVIGAILAVLGMAGHAVGGRRHYF